MGTVCKSWRKTGNGNGSEIRKWIADFMSWLRSKSEDFNRVGNHGNMVLLVSLLASSLLLYPFRAS